MSVIVNAPSMFQFTASACPARHIHAAARLGAEIRGATNEDAVEIVAAQLIKMMKATGIPNGVGFAVADAAGLTKGA